jgi:hypothetical protein
MATTATQTVPGGTSLQRLGEFIALVQSVLFAFLGLLHFGVDLTFAGLTLDEPPRILMAVVECALALGLLLSVVLPGRGALRAGRVIAAQAIAVMMALIGQIVFVDDLGPRTRTNDLFYAAMLALSFASMLLIAWHRVPRARMTKV